jgi:hypothetical protein
MFLTLKSTGGQKAGVASRSRHMLRLQQGKGHAPRSKRLQMRPVAFAASQLLGLKNIGQKTFLIF